MRQRAAYLALALFLQRDVESLEPQLGKIL